MAQNKNAVAVYLCESSLLWTESNFSGNISYSHQSGRGEQVRQKPFWPTEPKILSLWSFTGNVYSSLPINGLQDLNVICQVADAQYIF